MPDAVIPNHHLPVPSDWIARTEVHGGDGTLPHCVVLREIPGDLHPFVVHTAIEASDFTGWDYCHGKYHKDKAEAMQSFLDTAKRYGYKVL